MSVASRRGSVGTLLAGLGLVVGSLLAVATSGCEAILGTGSLTDDAAGSEAGVQGDDDDDDDDDEASIPDAGPEGSTRFDGATTGEGGPDAGDASHGGDGGGADGGDGSSEGGADGGPASCVASANPSALTCGVNGNDDCCATAPVPGDTYDRTYDDDFDFSDLVTVSGYSLDAYEVTVGRMRAYAAYLAAGGAAPTAGSGLHRHLNDGRGLLVVPATNVTYESGWLASYDPLVVSGAGASASFASTSCATTYTAAAASTDNRPVNCVDWYDAYAFCIWDGGFLPTEAEWELAAMGGSLQDDYPWGDTPAPETGYAVFDCSEETATTCPAPVGTAYRGHSGTGQFDLLGNVAEWTLDDYVSSYEDSDSCTDCAELNTAATTKVDRGGAFTDTAGGGYLTPQSRGSFTATTHDMLAGFRCARAPE